MTVLYLNDKKCVLPADFSFTLKKVSLFWTEETDHTFDMDIDLTSAENRIIFGHITRYNVNKQIPEMTAKLMINGRLILVGIVYLLELNGDNLKIQIVGEGNSFSYKSEDTESVDGAKMLYNLDLGKINSNKINAPTAYRSLKGCYPERNFVCLPTLKNYKRNSIIMFDISSTKWQSFANCVSPGNLEEWNETQNIIGHPYLLFLVERICSSLGYTIRNNDLLNDEQACREVIITSFTSLDLVDHVPSWSVAKFFREIEKHFNALCLFNSLSKTVDIFTFRNEIQSQEISYINNVLDKPDIKFEEEDNTGSIERNFTNVRYNFPDKLSFYKEADLSDDVMSLCTIKDIDSLKDVAPYNDKVISRYKGLYFIRRREEYHPNYFYDYIVPVNIYHHKGHDNNVVELNIIPCIHSMAYARQVSDENTDNESYSDLFAVPVVVPSNENSNESEGESTDQTLDDMINDGVKEHKRKIADQIFIAVYNGIQKNEGTDGGTQFSYDYPEIAVPILVDIVKDVQNGARVSEYIIQKEQRFGLSLYGSNSLSSRYYISGELMKEDYYYRIPFVINEIIEPGQVVLRNRRMFCSSIEYKVTDKGLTPIAEGEFYEINI